MMKFLNLVVNFGILFSCALAAESQVHRRQTAQRSAQHGRNMANHTGAAPEFAANGYVERLYGQVASIAALEERQLKKLEDLDYKMARLEGTNKDRLDALREELKEISRKAQNLDWMSGKSEAHLEQLKNELEAIRVNLNSHDTQTQIKQREAPPPGGDDDNNDVSCAQRLTSLAILLTSTRSAIQSVEQKIDALGTNVSDLWQVSRELHQRQSALPTKQFLSNALHSARNQPVYAVLPSVSESSPPVSSLPSSCLQASQTLSGITRLQSSPVSAPFYVSCDGVTQNGGWTVIQRRIDGAINFNRNWLEYKNGFGNIAGEFFMGLDKLHELTSSNLHELIIVMEDFKNETKYAMYSEFAIGGEKEDYALHLLGEYEGTAGDSLSFSASYKFSTFDNDNDGWVEGNCAQAHTGAWWYNACEMSNLNGQYLGGIVPSTHQFQGIYWNEFNGPLYSLKSVKMMIRPVEKYWDQDLD